LNDLLILDDTCNANPESVIGMLETLSRLKRKRTVGVIGQLAELEEDLRDSAAYILDHLPAGLTHLYFSGASGRILAPMVVGRFPELRVNWAESLPDLIAQLKPLAESGTVMGIKGSRSAHMERVVYAMQGECFSCNLTPCFRLNACRVCPLFQNPSAASVNKG